jgi:hypothetical protein
MAVIAATLSMSASCQEAGGGSDVGRPVRTEPAVAVEGVGPAAGVQVVGRPAGAGERPLVLVAEDEAFARVTDIELHARLPVPAVVDAPKKIIEETLLQLDAVAAREQRPMRVAVDFQPFRRAVGRLRETVEVAARVYTLAAPVRAGEKRRAHERQIR